MSFAGVGSQEPGHLVGAGQGSGAAHDPLEKVEQPVTLVLDGGAGVGSGGPKVGLAGGQAVAFQLDGAASGVQPHQDKLAVVGNQHLVVAGQIFDDLQALSDFGQVNSGAFDFNRASGGWSSGEGVRGVELKGF